MFCLVQASPTLLLVVFETVRLGRTGDRRFRKEEGEGGSRAARGRGNAGHPLDAETPTPISSKGLDDCAGQSARAAKHRVYDRIAALRWRCPGSRRLRLQTLVCETSSKPRRWPQFEITSPLWATFPAPRFFQY